MPIPESEQRGKAECVPIKKRRYLIKSPSPPPRGSPVHSQEIDKHKVSDSGLAQGSNPDSCLGVSVTADVASSGGVGEIINTDVVVDVKKSDIHVSSECISGMSILADAACNDSLGRDAGFVELGPSTQDLTAHESSPQLLSKNESNFSLNGLSRPDLSSVNVQSEGTGSSISSFEICNGSSTEHTEAAGQDHLSKDEGTVRTPQCSSRKDRLHWDLNFPMEEWVFPNEVVDPQTNIVEGNCEESEHVKLNNKMEDAQGDYLQTTPGVFKVGTEKALPSMNQELKDSDKLECNMNMSIKVEKTIFLPETEKLMSFGMRSSSDKDLVMEIKPLDCHETNRSDGLASSYSVEHAPKPSKSTNENYSQCVSLGSTGSSGASSLHQGEEIAVYKSDKMVSPHLKDESDPNQADDKNVHPIKISSHDNTDDQIDSVSGTKSECNAWSSALTARPSSLGSNDDVQRSYTSDIADNCEILDPKEHLKYNDDSDTLQNGSASLAGIQQTVDSQLDYDSQYEDGELRDSAEPPWEECDVEDTEAELVDYGSDDREMYSYHQMADVSGSYAETSVDDAAALDDKKLDRGHECVKDNVDVSALVDMKTTEASRDHSPESLKSSINAGIRGHSNGNNRSDSGIDAEGSEADIFRSRAIRREWQPHINDQTNRGIIFRKDRQHGGRFRDYDDSESRYVGERGTAKSFRTGTDSGHIRFQSWKANQGTDNRGLKRRLSPTYHLPTDSRERGPESITSVVSGRVSNYGRVRSDGNEHSSLTWIQITGASSHGADGLTRRNGSPADRNRNVGTNLVTRTAGKFIDGSATGNQGDYIRRIYGSRVDDKVRRGRYHEPVPDDCIDSSSNYSHHFPSRERSFSPVGRRRDLHANCPSSKSPKRPRTRSPYRWQSPKGRNGDGLADRPSSTHRSRSPDFRSQGRMLRTRLPHQREGYSMLTARRPSQQCNSRWADDRVEAGRCREMDYNHHSSTLDRRSPTRIFSSSKTLNIAESQQRQKQIEYSRPMNPGRAPRLDRVGREGPRQEGG